MRYGRKRRVVEVGPGRKRRVSRVHHGKANFFFFPLGQGPTTDSSHTESGLMVHTARIVARATNGNVDGYVDKQNTQVYNTRRKQNGWALGDSDISGISANEWRGGQRKAGAAFIDGIARGMLSSIDPLSALSIIGQSQAHWFSRYRGGASFTGASRGFR